MEEESRGVVVVVYDARVLCRSVVQIGPGRLWGAKLTMRTPPRAPKGSIERFGGKRINERLVEEKGENKREDAQLCGGGGKSEYVSPSVCLCVLAFAAAGEEVGYYAGDGQVGDG